jgi:hypothetical protein
MRAILCQEVARLLAGALLLAALDEVLAVHEAVQRDVGFELYVQTFAELTSAEAGEEQGRFAQGFAGESAPVDAGAAQLAIGFDDDGLVTRNRPPARRPFRRRVRRR